MFNPLAFCLVVWCCLLRLRVACSADAALLSLPQAPPALLSLLASPSVAMAQGFHPGLRGKTALVREQYCVEGPWWCVRIWRSCFVTTEFKNSVLLRL